MRFAGSGSSSAAFAACARASTSRSYSSVDVELVGVDRAVATSAEFGSVDFWLGLACRSMYGGEAPVREADRDSDKTVVAAGVESCEGVDVGDAAAV